MSILKILANRCMIVPSTILADSLKFTNYTVDHHTYHFLSPFPHLPLPQLPIMFLAPKLYLTPLESVCGSLGGFSSSAILGYGDVAIPSLLIALCLQFDLSHRSKSCCLRLYFLICSIGGCGLHTIFRFKYCNVIFIHSLPHLPQDMVWV